MPVYEYECPPCRVIYEDRRTRECILIGPNLNRGNHSSPTEARYSKMSAREEIAREKILQKGFERIWLPPPVKHSPWE